MLMEMQKLYKKFILFSFLMFFSTTILFAAPLGFYGGLQLMASRIDQESLQTSDVASDTNSVLTSQSTFTVGPATYSSLSVNTQSINSFEPDETDNPYGVRIFFGYAFMPYFAMEGGFSGFQRFKREYTANTNTVLNGSFIGGGSLVQNGAMVEREDSSTLFILDMAVKAIYPFRSGFEVFAKVGYTLFWEQIESERKFTFATPAMSQFTVTNKRTNRRTAPLIGIGASFYVSPISSIDLAWTRIAPHATDTDADEKNDFLSLGVTFYAGGRYC